MGRYSHPFSWIDDADVETKILITGGLGFIGSNFIRHLFAMQGRMEITNLDSMSYGSCALDLAHSLPDRHYRFFKGDIADNLVVKNLVEDAELVVNFAAETHVDRSIASGRAFVRSNIVGVYSILEGLRHSKRNTRFIQVGTDEEYGEIEEGSFTEESVLRPSSPYAATKASASMLVSAYARTYGLDALVTRCTNNFGPYQFPEKLIPKTIIRAMKNLPVPIYGSGKQVRDWIYVKDYCEALLAVIKRGRTGEIYNVSAGNEVDNLSLVRRILSIMHKETSLIEHVEDRPGHDFRYSLDSRKIRDELGWKPKCPFRKALAKTVRWYVKSEDWWRPLADRRVLHPTPWKLRW